MRENRSPIYITHEDMKKLKALLSSATNPERDQECIAELEEELDKAIIVDSKDIPRQVITMNSKFCLRSLEDNKLHVLTLVYPHEADISKGKLSILAPVGVAVIGYRVCDIIEWDVPKGAIRLRVESIIYQPEADLQKQKGSQKVVSDKESLIA